jgi:hypothetical protein
MVQYDLLVQEAQAPRIFALVDRPFEVIQLRWAAKSSAAGRVKAEGMRLAVSAAM